jgi:endo-1,4-beta-D-glucanase Y
MLTAGPWATGSPATLNPSYWALPAFTDLARATGDRRWGALAASSLALARRLSRGGTLLPPDWARVDGTSVSATASPNGQFSQVQYALDAQRLVVWLGASCDPSARALAASWWASLAAPAAAPALALHLDGSPIAASPSPMALVGAAAAAGAAGHAAERDRLLSRAAAVNNTHPAYYGSAWVALGRALLTTGALGGCAAQGTAK